MNMKIAGVILAVLVAAALTLMPSIDSNAKSGVLSPKQELQLAERAVMIDPAELLELIHNRTVGQRILDVRNEADYNLFHIVDAFYVTEENLTDSRWLRALPKKTAFVVVSNDEATAVEAWKLLAAQKVPNIYILEGGVNFWLDIYGRNYGPDDNINSLKPSPGDDTFRHTFKAALGDRHPGADPEPHIFPERIFDKKVKQIGVPRKKSGGCG